MDYKFFTLNQNNEKTPVGEVSVMEHGEAYWKQKNPVVSKGLNDFTSVELVDDDNPEGKFDERNYSHWQMLPFLFRSPYLWVESSETAEKIYTVNEWPELTKMIKVSRRMIKVDFDETEHPRKDDGKFAPKGEGGGGGGHEPERRMPKRMHMGGGRFTAAGKAPEEKKPEPTPEPEPEKKPEPEPEPEKKPTPPDMPVARTVWDIPEMPAPEENWHKKPGAAWNKDAYDRARNATTKGLNWRKVSDDEFQARANDASEFRAKREDGRWTVRYLENGKVLQEAAHSKNRDIGAERLVGKGGDLVPPEPPPVPAKPPEPEPAPEPEPEKPEKHERTIPKKMKREPASFHKYPDSARTIHSDFHSDPGWKKWILNLKPSQARAIQRYIGKRGEGWVAEAEEVNSILRKHGDTGKYTGMIHDLDQALNAGELHKDMILYRAASSSKPDRYDAIADGTLAVGGTLSDDGFISTSPKYGTATLPRFLNPRIKPYPILYRIKAPKGTKGAYVSWPELDNPYMEESEFLMPRSTKFTIEKMGYEEVNGKRTAVLDLRVGE